MTKADVYVSVAAAVLAAIALFFILRSVIKRGGSELYTPYPFHPINPQYVIPTSAQSVFGQPSQKFQLTTTPDQREDGAYAALQIAQSLQEYNNELAARGLEWKTSDTPETKGNTQFAMSLASPPFNAWDTL